MIIPEVTLFNFLNGIIQYTNDNYKEASDKDKSLLGLFFKQDDYGYDIKITTFDFYEQAVAVLVKDFGNVRRLHVNIGYNLQHLATPTIHVLLPNESPGGFEGLGVGEGYEEETYDEATGETSLTHTTTYNTSYNLLITSDNMSEVLLVYNWLKGMFTMLKQQIELMGLRLPEISGADINFDDSLAPPNIFHRNFIVSCQYESSYKNLFAGNTAKNVISQICSNFYKDNEEEGLKNKNIHGITSA